MVGAPTMTVLVTAGAYGSGIVVARTSASGLVLGGSPGCDITHF